MVVVVVIVVVVFVVIASLFRFIHVKWTNLKLSKLGVNLNWTEFANCSSQLSLCSIAIPALVKQAQIQLGQKKLQLLLFLSIVIWKPVFTVHPVDVVAKEGTDAIFKCAATGSPHPKVSWFKNDSLFPNTTVTQNESISYLILHSVAKGQNNKMYKCLGTNLAGRTYSNGGRLTVVSRAASIPTINETQPTGKNWVS